MAKFGGGNLLLGEERPNATNVNNFHWSEKRASEWSKYKLSELIIGLKIHTEVGFAELTEILRYVGDAVIINQRGKFFYFYEWSLKIKWKGITHGGVVTEGLVSIDNLTELNDIEGTDIHVDFQEDGAGAESTFLVNVMKNEGVQAIREQLSKYVIELKDFAKDLILSTPSVQQLENNLHKETYSHWLQGEQKVPDEEMECKSETDDKLSLKETFKCTSEELFRALTIQELIQVYTKSDCISEPVNGGKFQHFGGNIQGYFVNLKPFHTIVLKWRFVAWPKDHFSDVSIHIIQKIDCTELNLKQFGIPEGQKECTEHGWKRHYCESLKKYFGFGAFLF